MTEAKTEQQLMEEFKKEWVGKRVKIIGDHPHSGTTGTITSLDKIGASPGWGLKVESDDGWSKFYVMHKRNLKVI